MKNRSLTLSIDKPCQENWNTFTPAENGRFCDACNNVVLDFTTASDAKILAFLTNKPAHACGRFRSNQLKTYTLSEPRVKPGLRLVYAGVLSIALLLINRPGFTQNAETSNKPLTTYYATAQDDAITKTMLTIRGVVLDEAGNAMPGVSVVLKGTSVGTATDEQGKFVFPQQLKAGDVLAFYYLGYQTLERSITDEQELRIDLTAETHVLLGAVAVQEPYTPKESFFKRVGNALRNLF